MATASLTADTSYTFEIPTDEGLNDTTEPNYLLMRLITISQKSLLAEIQPEVKANSSGKEREQGVLLQLVDHNGRVGLSGGANGLSRVRIAECNRKAFLCTTQTHARDAHAAREEAVRNSKKATTGLCEKILCVHPGPFVPVVKSKEMDMLRKRTLCGP